MKRQINIRYNTLAAEQELFDLIHKTIPSEIAKLGTPVYVLTPTNFLRDHLEYQAVHTYGISTGVCFLSLYEFARRVILRAGQEPTMVSGLLKSKYNSLKIIFDLGVPVGFKYFFQCPSYVLAIK